MRNEDMPVRPVPTGQLYDVVNNCRDSWELAALSITKREHVLLEFAKAIVTSSEYMHYDDVMTHAERLTSAYFRKLEKNT